MTHNWGCFLHIAHCIWTTVLQTAAPGKDWWFHRFGLSNNMKYLSHLGFFLSLLNEVGVVAPVAASDESQHQRRHRVYLLVRGGRMRRAHRFGLSSSVNWICVRLAVKRSSSERKLCANTVGWWVSHLSNWLRFFYKFLGKWLAFSSLWRIDVQAAETCSYLWRRCMRAPIQSLNIIARSFSLLFLYRCAWPSLGPA